MTLEELIRECPSEWGLIGSEYTIKVQDDNDGRLHVYARPSDRSGHTIDFTIKGNELTELFNTKDLKYE